MTDNIRTELDFVIEKRLEHTAQALRKNRMSVTCVNCADDVPSLVASLMPAGSVVAAGRSATLEECGVTKLLLDPKYNYIDRYAAKTDSEKDAVKAAIICSDYFLASANAVTLDGELYFVDGHASRIGPIAYGPKNVILVVGMNKIVSDLQAARIRVEQIAAPANAKRQNSATPCAVTGTCQHCHSPGRICCSTLILGPQRVENRIHVILVKESLGY